MHRNPETDGEIIYFGRKDLVRNALSNIENHPRIKALREARPVFQTTAEQLRTIPYDISAPQDEVTSRRIARKLYETETQESSIAISKQNVEDAYSDHPPNEGDAANWVNMLASQEDNRAA